MPERLVVIGGDAAGMAAASQVRRRRPDMEIIAVERGAWTSYSACGIPYHVAGDVPELEDLVARSPREYRERLRIDVRLHHEATAIDLDARRVEVCDLQHGRTIHLPFDQLMIGTGARPVRPDLPGIDADWIMGVQTLDDAAALLDYARSSHSKKVVVVGGGYIGLEMAEAFVRWGAEVTLVEGEQQLMRTLDADMAEPLCEAVRKIGIDLRLGKPVHAFEDKQVLIENDELAADIVILGLGVVPNSEIADRAGLTLGVRHAVQVDHRQRTSAEGVFAAGDCADTYHRVSHRRVHVALGTVANKTARVAGTNLAGGYARFPGVVGTAITKICGTEIARTGLTERECATAGFEQVNVVADATAVAGYFPGAEHLSLKLLAERGTGRVLGAQVVGGQGSAKRIDTVATALTAGMGVADLIDLDLAYAPPFASVWDPIQDAARRLLPHL